MQLICRTDSDSQTSPPSWIRIVLTFTWICGCFCATAHGQSSQPLDPSLVRELFISRCADCHGAETRESGLRLDTQKGIRKGGDFGPIAISGKPETSELIHRVTSNDEKKVMPPDGPRLTESEVALLEQWIQEGLPWTANEHEEDTEVDPRMEHWAWQPLVIPQIPTSPTFVATPENTKSTTIESARNPIDHFIREKLAQQNLLPSPLADRRTLIRRLFFDLHGLPPSPEQIQEFVEATDPQAYEKLVDRLLESPRYGERWARHWLDVVHYGDTHGYDKDQPRPNAWPYRDYVIRALNEDKPYARFIEEQIAGDILYPETRDGFEALGMIAAGPWDFIGHVEVPETKTDGKIARHLDRDDMVANTIGTFCSVTIQCAQCHQHKFDPISQEDYYSLQAVFAAIDRDDREYSPDPLVQQTMLELKHKISTLKSTKSQIESSIASRGGDELKRLDQQIREAGKSPSTAQGGYHSNIEASDQIPKWVQVDLGSTQEIQAVSLHPCYDDFNSIGAGFGFPKRFRIEVSDDPEFKQNVLLVSDQTQNDYPNPGVEKQTFTANAKGRFLRVTATQLVKRANDFIFALAEIEILSSTGENLASKKTITALDSIEAPPRWTLSNAVNGVSPQNVSADVPTLRIARKALLVERGLSTESDSLDAIERDLASTEKSLKDIGPLSKVYSATTHKRGGVPRNIQLLARGNVLNPIQDVAPGTLSLISSLSNRFELRPDHSEGERRVALARWLTDPQNPLTWRSIVNRVWQHHFSQGIVNTPNDFGRMGSPPTNQELLDWLAVWFRDQGGSMKELHKLIVCSATYRQASTPRAECLASDADNRYLWRYTPRRLEAEALRDSVLAVSGTLDLRAGGPGWQDFKIERPEHSPHYEYQLADPEDRSTWRRSIYRFIVRSQTQPFMTVLDCADPSMRVDKRNQSISAQQALALLNNGIMLVQAREFAKQTRAQAGKELKDQVQRAYKNAIGREPESDELTALIELGELHGLENVCRTLFNLNEFVWVD
jgi:mono/diheme cytochrome c family protein